MTNAAALRVEGLRLRIGSFELQDISFDLQQGETLVILGPNGAGKSMLLETIAGFHRPARGRIEIDGREMTDAAPEHRRVGLMVQDFALFPHLSVKDNVAFGMRRRGGSRGRVDEILGRFGLEPLAHRKPQTLSGGERQRVALARALAVESTLLLFDEPFSALDPTQREELREELRDLLRALRVASIYVTHDRLEAQLLADRVGVLREGRLLQIAPVDAVFRTPADAFVARFVGVENLLDGRVVAAENGRLRIALGAAHVEARGQSLPAGSDVLLCVRAEDVLVGAEARQAGNSLAGRVARVREHGPLAIVELDCGFPLTAYVGKRQAAALGETSGGVIQVGFHPEAAHTLPR